ncbi:hypothetical protein MHM84_03710 [Halomonas sp. McH1-25]|uniref:DnaT-like ssDNA-binding protein n=1 Tax=unclassified Halomonas TaxID=2609666 RepID=UPI001EF6B243|nr:MULTISPECIES: DnaT-like ssDNA-binding protein [unclassified Halomonas]MCG7598879.1 hypothetical protein [Halomonas sp. McH1-25]MCP1340842.1 hypothetical protein [Halomonas sp. FL8]MCP1361275.1 hypothetical protein [Halomonas sp. BBD45]MCP1363698.1 hypothetical protein [Halomonas sp. BBD48]
MAQYITVTDVDTQLGSDWAEPAAKDRAVRQANAWLTAKLSGREFDTVPTPIIEAGAELAQMAANGTLYADSDGDVKRESVEADTVSVETEYQDGSRAVQGALLYVLDLLKPWLNPYGSVTLLKRL